MPPYFWRLKTIETPLERYRRYGKEHPENNQAKYPVTVPAEIGEKVEWAIGQLKQENVRLKRQGVVTTPIAAVIDRLETVFGDWQGDGMDRRELIADLGLKSTVLRDMTDDIHFYRDLFGESVSLSLCSLVDRLEDARDVIASIIGKEENYGGI